MSRHVTVHVTTETAPIDCNELPAALCFSVRVAPHVTDAQIAVVAFDRWAARRPELCARQPVSVYLHKGGLRWARVRGAVAVSFAPSC